MKHRSISHLFQKIVDANRDRAALRFKRDGEWVPVTWAEQAGIVRNVGKALIGLGVRKGDRVGILSLTRPEWVQCDLGIVTIGAVTVGIYPSNLAPDCAYIVNHSDAEIVFVENREQLDKLRSVRADMPGLRKFVLIDGRPEPGDEDTLSWSDFLAHAESIADETWTEYADAVESSDLASLVYTSGTTGVPKGVMLSHGNILFTTESVEQSLSIEPHYVTLAFLPLAHVFARLISYACLTAAVEVYFSEDFTKLAQNLREVRPQFITSVPRIYEKVYDKVVGTAAAAGGARLKLFNWSIETGLRVSRLLQAGRPIPPGLRLRHAIADRLVLHKVRDAMGGRLAWGISGAAPLSVTVAEFFHACGVLLLEGIGMTENTSFSHVNRFHANRFGTVGQPGPGVECRIAEDGEVLFRGGNVMQGYFKNPEATAETIDADGWLLSGDIGEIDADGYLRITDRKKDLIITAGGKNVAPQRIERTLRSSRFLAQVVAYGDRRKYITALVALDADPIAHWATENGITDTDVESLAANPRVHELIATEVEMRNRELASFETVKKFHILPGELSIEAGDLTPTLKVKRKVVYEKYREELESLY